MLDTAHAPDGALWLAELVRAEYSDATRLLTRERLYDHEVPRLDVHACVAARVRDCRGLVVDVGCGTGRTLAHLRAGRRGRSVVGVDVSETMLRTAKAAGRGGALVAGDGCALPFRDGTASAVLAVHVLYLLPDPTAALREMARVLAPGGPLVVVTTNEEDKAALHQLIADAVCDAAGAEMATSADLHRRCTADAAAAGMTALGLVVDRLDLRSQVRLTDPQPLVDYVASMGPRFRYGLGPAEWASGVLRLRAALEGFLQADGEIVLPTHVVVLVGRRGRTGDVTAPAAPEASSTAPRRGPAPGGGRPT
jgi:SAM-dependent methyltransferase